MDGVINVLKPPGMSSSNAVAFIKKTLNVKKAGHCGTLDPGACGALCVCVGKGTKLSQYLMDGEKVYRAEFVFGKNTDTLDSYGVVTGTCDKAVSKEEIEETAKLFTGEITQLPPMFSAVKINGQKMYKLARKGKEFGEISGLVKERRAYIDYIKILKCETDKCFLEISCSKGTYIRSICADMARKLGTCGYMSFLLRRKSSHFSSDEGYTLDEIKSMSEKGDFSFITPVEEAAGFMPSFILDDYFFKMITTGAVLDVSRLRNGNEAPKGEIRVYCKDKFIGVGENREDKLKIKALFYTGDSV